jgi:hypothetical protein
MGTALFAIFLISNNINLYELVTYHWYWGLLAAAVAAAVVIRNVLAQPASKRHTGFDLFIDLLWPGFAYGLVDALLLSVIPILAVKFAFANVEWTQGWLGALGLGAIALLTSLLVTAIYHLGYPEYRGKNVLWTMFGNGILSLAFLLTMNPLAAILPHIAMHMAAMVHGKDSTGQVPPHYDQVATH